MYDGLADRLKYELLKYGASAETKVIAGADSKIISWKGASIFGSTYSLQAAWITAKDYEEHGPCAVLNKKGF